MKLLHTSDLHIGKSVHDFSMLEDQKHVLKQIYEIARRERVDAVLIAGDIYDRSVPSAEAVRVLDDFLTRILDLKTHVIIISGNHDSPERVGFAGRILEKQGLHIAGVYEGQVKQVLLEDCYGPVLFDCLPFVRPAEVGAANSQEAMTRLLSRAAEQMAEPEGRPAEAGGTCGHKAMRRLLLAHCFVTDGGREPVLSDSETMVHVGGLDNVDASLFAEYAYVALGHIHRSQRIGAGPVYYAGAPLKYSFSEVLSDKSVNLVTLGASGEVQVEKRELTPLHDMRKIRGSLAQIMEAAGEEKDYAYIQATLTDRAELVNPLTALRSVYPNLMQLLFEKQTLADMETAVLHNGRSRSPQEMFADFYELVRDEPMEEAQREAVRAAMARAEEETE